MKDCKVVFFTNMSSHGNQIMKRMLEQEIVIDTIIVERPIFSYRVFGMLKKLKIWDSFKYTLRICFNLFFEKGKREPWKKYKYYKGKSKHIYSTLNFNDARTIKLLNKISPDFIVLGGSRILKKNVLEIPRIGVLNAHPGILPYYKGCGVIPWALANNDNVGVTLHFVDSGVDTGKIIDVKELNITKEDTLKTLKVKSEQLGGILVCKYLNKVINGENELIDLEENSTTIGRTYLTKDLTDEVKEKAILNLKQRQSKI